MTSCRTFHSLKPLGFIALISALLVSVSAASTEKRLPSKVDHEECTLVLNGSKVRKVWGFDVYEAGLYLTQRCQSEKQIMAGDFLEKRVHISMLREVSGEKFRDSLQKSIDGNFSSKEKKEYAAELKQFLGCFGDGSSLNKGSVIHIDYVPEKGTLITVDGSRKNIIEGDEFYHAILRFWIGNPSQASMKPGLLGKN